jgi:HPt (histidine-containing phosphotransfer) domain-containing protein
MVVSDPLSISALESELDVEGAREILQSFLEDTEGVIARMENSVQVRDQEKLRADSHMLAGTGRAIKAQELIRLSKNLENAAMTGDWESAAQQLPEVKTTYDGVTIFIRGYLQAG